MKKVFRILLAVCLTALLSLTFVACGNNDNKKPDDGKPAEELTIKFNQSAFNLTKGTSQEISVTVTGSDEQVEFKASNRNVAVTTTGKTTATVEGSNAGKSIITASVGKVKATLSITVVEYGLQLVGENVLSVSPGKTQEFAIKLLSMPNGTQVTVESDSTDLVTAKVKDGSLTSVGATIEFTGAADAKLGETAKITVKAEGVDPIEVEVDTYSDGILFGDGHYQARYLTLNEFGVVARGVGRNFSGGELVIPRRVYYTPEQNIDKYLDKNAALDYGSANKSFWAPVTCLGVRTGDNETNQPSMPDTVYKFEKVAPFYIAEGVNITSLNTGDSVQYICEKAFKDYEGLTKVHIGKSVIHVCDDAFNNEKVFAKSNVLDEDKGYLTTNGEYVYDGTIEDLTFSPDCAMTTVGENAFAYNKLTKIILPDTVAVLAGGVFRDCGVEYLKFPKALTKSTARPGVYHGWQFYDLFSLKEIYIPWQINYSLDPDFFLEASKPAEKAKAEEVAATLGITGYGHLDTRKETVYADGRFFDVASFTLNGDFKNHVDVYYMGPRVLMDNLLSIQNHIVMGDWYKDADGKYYTTKETTTDELVHSATVGRRMHETGWVPPICEHFLDKFFTKTTKNIEPYGDITQYELGNSKVEWKFDRLECPYNVDGTVKA